MADTARAYRVATAAWVIAGTAVMYAMAIALAKEMADFPGGPEALAASVMPGVEALRPMRWPAERLDTLGGYLTYHNITLLTYVLAVYAVVQGARAVRGAEERHALEQILATGWSRWAVIRDRTAGFVATLILICLGLGLGTAAAMAAGGEPALGGSLITTTAVGLCATVAYALGVLISQLTRTSRAAAGAGAVLLTVLYVGTNIWEQLGPLGALRFVSPFYYAGFSRALVPGYGFDIASMAALLAMSAVCVGLAAWAFQRRDYGSPLWARRPATVRRATPPGRASQWLLGAVWRAILLRGRFGLLAWAAGAAAFSGLMMLLQPTVIDAWAVFESYFSGAGGGAGVAAETQYASFAAEMVAPIIAAFVISQAAGWVADLEQGRVEVVLAGPVSWSRLVWERLLALAIGIAVIVAGTLCGLVAGSAVVGAKLDVGGLGRLVVDCVLLGAALGAVACVLVTSLRRSVAVTLLAVFVAGSYLLLYIVPLLEWPSWVGRLSVFIAFGNPYLEWPSLSGIAVMLALAIVGGLVAAGIAERTPKAV